MIVACFWALWLAALVSPPRYAFYLFSITLPFEALNVVPGAVTIVPYAACAPMMAAKILGRGDTPALVDAVLNWRRLGLLTGYILLSLIVTATAPFLFAGAPTMGLNTGVVTGLAFGPGNETQLAYLLASFGVTVAAHRLMLDDEGRAILARGLLMAGGCYVVAGALDVATAGSDALAPLRTATYHLLTDVQLGGARRVVGFSTEASVFGSATLTLGAIHLFVRPARVLGARLEAAGIALGVVLLVFCVLSTSSGAYLGLATLVGLLVAVAIWRMVIPRGRVGALLALASIGLLAAVVTLFFVFRPDVAASTHDTLDSILFSKTGSDSFAERSLANRVSLAGLAETLGYGLGIGSTRASSWPVAVFSEAGIIAAALMLAFLLRSLLARVTLADPGARGMVTGARAAWLVWLTAAAVVVTLVDTGPLCAILFGVMAAGEAPAERWR